MTIVYEHILHARRMAVPFVGGAAQPSTSSLVNPAGGRERLNHHPEVGTRPRSFAANSCAVTTAEITRLSWGLPLGGPPVLYTSSIPNRVGRHTGNSREMVGKRRES